MKITIPESIKTAILALMNNAIMTRVLDTDLDNFGEQDGIDFSERTEDLLTAIIGLLNSWQEINGNIIEDVPENINPYLLTGNELEKQLNPNNNKYNTERKWLK